MKKQQLYFLDEDSETCHTLEYHLENAKSDELKEIELFEAVPDPSKDYFWCRADSSVCMSDDNPCGKSCEDYDPRNGKSGICKHKTHCYTWSNKVKFNVQTGEQMPIQEEFVCPICGIPDDEPTKCTMAFNCLNTTIAQEKAMKN